jgi:hypothetical protein
LLERFVRQSTEIDVEKYLKICEQLGEEPDPEKMPLAASAFPDEVQMAFFIFDLLSDRWDGMSGTYMGKDWVDCSFIMDLYEVENKKQVIYFAKTYERLVMAFRSEEAEKRRKAEERKSKAGGGANYTHNVKG